MVPTRAHAFGRRASGGSLGIERPRRIAALAADGFLLFEAGPSGFSRVPPPADSPCAALLWRRDAGPLPRLKKGEELKLQARQQARRTDRA